MASNSGIVFFVVLGALALGSADGGCRSTADGTPAGTGDQGDELFDDDDPGDDDFSFEPDPEAVTTDDDDFFDIDLGDLFDDDDPGDDDFSFEPESP